MSRLQTMPKFEQVAELLRERLRLGVWAPGEKLPGERALAREFGVAHLTMNKAIAGLVANGLVERRQGDGTYVREAPAQSTLAQTVVAMVDTRAERHDVFLSALPPFLQSQSLYPMLLHWESVIADPEPLARMLADAPAAFIANGRCGLPVATLSRRRERTRLVILGNSSQGACVPGSYILNDFMAGGRLAAEHLLSTGCRRVLVLGPPDADQVDVLARDAFLKSATELLEAAGAPWQMVPAARLTEADYRELFTTADFPDGVLGTNDFRLVPAIAGARSAGRDVPGEVRGVGQFDTPWAVSAGLSSVAMDLDAMLGQLREILDGGDDRIVMLPPHLIVRTSSHFA